MNGLDFSYLAPFLILSSGPLLIMMAISVKRNYDVAGAITIFTLLLSLISLFFCAPSLPYLIEPLFIFDGFSLFFLGIILFSVLLVAVLSYSYFKQMEGIREEYFILLLIATLGSALLTVANHFILFFLGIETLSIALYILIAYLKIKDRSIEAGIKYLILASVSSAFLLFGMALIYTYTGTMRFDGLADAIGKENYLSPLFLAGSGLMLVGIGFKLALVPFHMWTPDIYHGAPAPVSAFISTVSKGAVMAVLIRFFSIIGGYENHALFMVISAIAVLSMFAGNILAIRQQNVKRILAYSSIANMGYLIIILLTGTDNGIRAAVFYLVSYLITSIGVWGVISLLSDTRYESENIEDFKGLFWKKPWLAIVFTISLLSLAGIPLTAGFIAKFYIVLEGVKTGLMILVFSLIISSVIGLYYYLRVITAMFSPADDRVLPTLSFSGKIVLSFVTISILLLGIYPGWLIDLLIQFITL